MTEKKKYARDAGFKFLHGIASQIHHEAERDQSNYDQTVYKDMFDPLSPNHKGYLLIPMCPPFNITQKEMEEKYNRNFPIPIEKARFFGCAIYDIKNIPFHA